MKIITVKELFKECEKEILSGNGDKEIYISADDEGNGFHPLFFSFTHDEKSLKEFYFLGCVDTTKNIVLLG